MTENINPKDFFCNDCGKEFDSYIIDDELESACPLCESRNWQDNPILIGKPNFDNK